MRIVGYFKTASGKGYIAFQEKEGEGISLTDGFHDKEKKPIEYIRAYYKEVPKEEVNVKKIVNRMRSTRGWHPLLRIMRKEVSA